jgi:chaperone modulatory protein CbpM
VTYALIPWARSGDALLSLDAFARATGTHPDLIRRLVALGVIEARKGRAGELWFPPDQVAALARVQRLRAAFALNYAAVGLVTDLLDRIADLQASLRASRRSGG